MRYFITPQNKPEPFLAFECVHYENEELKTVNLNYEIPIGTIITIPKYPGTKFSIAPYLTNDIISLIEGGSVFSVVEIKVGRHSYQQINDATIILQDGSTYNGKLFERTQTINLN